MAPKAGRSTALKPWCCGRPRCAASRCNWSNATRSSFSLTNLGIAVSFGSGGALFVFTPGNLGGFVFCYRLPWSPGLLVVLPKKSLGKKALDLLGLGGFPSTVTEPAKNVGYLVEGLLAGVSGRPGSVVGILLASATPSDRDADGQASRHKVLSKLLQ